MMASVRRFFEVEPLQRVAIAWWAPTFVREETFWYSLGSKIESGFWKVDLNESLKPLQRRSIWLYSGLLEGQGISHVRIILIKGFQPLFSLCNGVSENYLQQLVTDVWFSFIELPSNPNLIYLKLKINN